VSARVEWCGWIPAGGLTASRRPPRVPVADELLATKLLLETDEPLFLATAHRYPYH